MGFSKNTKHLVTDGNSYFTSFAFNSGISSLSFVVCSSSNLVPVSPHSWSLLFTAPSCSSSPVLDHAKTFWPCELLFLVELKRGCALFVWFGHRSGAICRFFKVQIGRKISKVCLQLFLFADQRLVCQHGYVKLHVGKCLFQSRTGLFLFLSAAAYIGGIPENKYELWGSIKSNKHIRNSPTSRTMNFEFCKFPCMRLSCFRLV